MDLFTYDLALPELPMLRGLSLEGGAPIPPLRIDWAAYVIRLAQVIAKQEGRPSVA